MKKISELTAVTSAADANELVINVSGATRKITVANLLKGYAPFKLGTSGGKYGYYVGTTFTPFRSATGNATVNEVLKNYTFSNDSGVGLTGNMTNVGSQTKTFTPSYSSQSQKITKGYHDGNGSMTCNAVSGTWTVTANAGRKADLQIGSAPARYINLQSYYDTVYAAGKSAVYTDYGIGLGSSYKQTLEMSAGGTAGTVDGYGETSVKIPSVATNVVLEGVSGGAYVLDSNNNQISIASWMNGGGGTYNITSHRGKALYLRCGISGYISGRAHISWYFT